MKRTSDMYLSMRRRSMPAHSLLIVTQKPRSQADQRGAAMESCMEARRRASSCWMGTLSESQKQ